jgi:hypothetical protein
MQFLDFGIGLGPAVPIAHLLNKSVELFSARQDWVAVTTNKEFALDARLTCDYKLRLSLSAPPHVHSDQERDPARNRPCPLHRHRWLLEAFD